MGSDVSQSRFAQLRALMQRSLAADPAPQASSASTITGDDGSTPKANASHVVHGDNVVTNVNVSGSIIVGRTQRMAWWQHLLVLAAVAVAVVLLMGWSPVDAAEPAESAVQCESVMSDDGRLLTSCVALRSPRFSRAFHASYTQQLFAALTSAANACIAAFYPPSSGLIHLLPESITLTGTGQSP